MSVTDTPRPRGRWLRLLPCLILVAVALGQILLALTAGLSPWHGGGFGMFATTDSRGARHLHVFAIRPGLEREVRPPPPLEHLAQRVRALPSQSNLRSLALEIAALPAPDHGPPTAVRIEVWRTRFDPDTLAPSSDILRALEVPLAAE